MLNGSIFYDNKKYFTSGYYSWLIFGTPVISGSSAETSVTSDAITTIKATSFKNLGAFSTPVEANGNAISNFLNNSSAVDQAEEANAIQFTFPKATSGNIVNISGEETADGVNASNGYAALVYFDNADSVTKVFGGVSVDLGEAKKKWNFIKSAGVAAEMVNSVSADTTVLSLDSLDTNSTIIYTTGVNISSVLNSYNYSGFTVGNLTVTLNY